MERVYNFSAGPSALPEAVLKKAAGELINYPGAGMSVMEMSHRSKPFLAILEGAQNTLRELMTIPDNYRILFLQGGAATQFGMVPLNLFRRSKKADYVNTGTWANRAINEAKRYGTVNVVASSKPDNFNYIPALEREMFDPEADYFHITTNNTIYGTRYRELPDVGDVPLVADMSSNILSEVYDVSRFGLIYAGAQKNAGPAGLTIVIVRDDLVGHAMEMTPTMYNYQVMVENDSMYNTPPCYSIYIAKLVFEWLRDLGGVAAIQKINEEKAAMLYDYLDNSALFKGTARKQDRSLMNIPFVLPTAELDALFIKEATARGLTTLKGHRSVGGMRASIYNAMPVEGVRKLVDFMKEFELAHKGGR